MAVGDLIYGGAIQQAIRIHQQAGGGSAGWATARQYIAQEYPGESPASVNALIRRAQQSAAMTSNYGPGGANYTPQPEQFPDHRRPIRAAGLPPGVQPGDVLPPRFMHEGIVEVRDERYGDTVIQRFSITVPSDRPLSKTELLEAIIEYGEDALGMFGQYDGVSDRLDNLSFMPRIVGGYRGY